MISIKRFLQTLLLALLPVIIFASSPADKENALAVFYVVDGSIEKEYNALVEQELSKIAFNVTDPHHRVNDQYKEKYGSTQLDVLSFLPVVNDDVVMKLFNTDPRLAGFSPFNMLIYKRLSDKVTHVGHLMPKAMLDMLGITDETVRKEFIASFVPLDKMIVDYLTAKKLHFKTEYIPYKNTTKQKMINFEYTFKAPEDMEEFIEEFQNKFELAFIDKEYLIAGFHNFLDTDNGEDVLEDFDAFWSYSLCHLSYSYKIFDNDNSRPDAGLYAPCTMYIYIKKESNKMVIGMPKLANVKNTLKVTDPTRVQWMDRLDREIPEILTSMGMVAVENVNPLTGSPKPLKVTTKKETATVSKAPSASKKKTEEKIKTDTETIDIILPVPPIPVKPVKVKTHSMHSVTDRSIKFSKRVPPGYVPSEERAKKAHAQNTNTNIGGINKGKISTYLRGKFMDVKTAEAKLKDAGFDIISVSPVDKKKQLISIVFTDKTLTEMGSKKDAAFMASLRLLVNKKDNHISITNPLYMAKAFMQKNYDEKSAKEVLAKITAKFPGLINSKDQLKFQLLPKYQFMNGMPQYQDMVTVARGDDLLAKLKDNKSVVFTQKLNNGATLVGVKLGKRTNKFTSRIGTNNAALLPYPVVIQNGEAKILEPKYYISVMYPLLQMSEFMTIATVPGAIIKDCTRIFR